MTRRPKQSMRTDRPNATIRVRISRYKYQTNIFLLQLKNRSYETYNLKLPSTSRALYTNNVASVVESGRFRLKPRRWKKEKNNNINVYGQRIVSAVTSELSVAVRPIVSRSVTVHTCVLRAAIGSALSGRGYGTDARWHPSGRPARNTDD